MKLSSAVAAVLLATLTLGALADVSVRGYTRRDGTYVSPHRRGSPNGIKSNNYSYRGYSIPYGAPYPALDMRMKAIIKQIDADNKRRAAETAAIHQLNEKRRNLEIILVHDFEAWLAAGKPRDWKFDLNPSECQALPGIHTGTRCW